MCGIINALVCQVARPQHVGSLTLGFLRQTLAEDFTTGNLKVNCQHVISCAMWKRQETFPVVFQTNCVTGKGLNSGHWSLPLTVPGLCFCWEGRHHSWSDTCPFPWSTEGTCQEQIKKNMIFFPQLKCRLNTALSREQNNFVAMQ